MSDLTVIRVPLAGNGHKQHLNGGETGFTGWEIMNILFLYSDISYNMKQIIKIISLVFLKQVWIISWQAHLRYKEQV